MQVLYLDPGHAAELVDPGDGPRPRGYYWLDIERTETGWSQYANRWLDAHLHEAHLRDASLVEGLNGRLPFYDGTDAYDLLVMRTLDVESPAEAPMTRPVAIFLTPRVVVSIRPPGDPVFARLRERLLGGLRKAPGSTAACFALLVNQIVGQLLDRRETVSELVGQWQDDLLEHDQPFDEWRSLLRLRNHLRRLEDVSEAQLDALSGWREQTSLELDAAHQGHFEALEKDLRRVFEHAAAMQSAIDSLVQTHYAIVGQQTNEILRVLTIISVVFLPLNLITGIFGMNFAHIPFLQSPYAPWLTVGLMGALAALLFFWLGRRRWF
jgi:Mg2+ and Co2+ transporter CorA